MELQVSDVFLRELTPDYSDSEVVIDIGSNTGRAFILFPFSIKRSESGEKETHVVYFLKMRVSQGGFQCFRALWDTRCMQLTSNPYALAMF